jgi:hypothetical protein
MDGKDYSFWGRTLTLWLFFAFLEKKKKATFKKA